jgi:hypothetical protein
MVFQSYQCLILLARVDVFALSYDNGGMQKVMLVIDDYNELVFTENLLKRMGFDVLSLNRDSTFQDAVLSFFPHVLIATLKGQHVEGLRLAINIKKKNANIKTVLLAPSAKDLTLPPEARVDALMDIPIQALPLLKELSRLLKLDETYLLEKFDKLNKARNFTRENDMKMESGEAGTGNTFVKGSTMQPSKEPSAREKRYAQFLDKHEEKVDKVIPHAPISAHTKEAAEADKSNPAIEESLLKQKREFVKALMKSKKA